MKRRVMAAVCAAAAACATAEAQFAPPAGIYALGRGQDLPGTVGDDRLDNIRDYDFVAGFTLRLRWGDIEPSPGVYDLGVIDEAFRRVAPLGQRINLEILNDAPAWAVAAASATYTDHNGNERSVPWDPFTKTRRSALNTVLADYVVDDGLGLPLSRHPVLAAVNTDPAGLNYGVRDLNDGLQSHPEYTRERYVDAVMEGVASGREAFPLHEGYLFFFSMDDDLPGERVDKQLLDLLDDEYNGAGQRPLSLFVENLSDNGPTAQPNGIGTGGNLREWADRGGGTMMQALDSWQIPPPARVEQLASLTPATGIQLAFHEFGTRFFELYVADLDAAAEGALDANGSPIAPQLAFWNNGLTGLSQPGDFDGDGDVDLADQTLWRQQSGSSVTPFSGADADGDGFVDDDDYRLWAANFGRLTPVVAAPVATPEPAAATLALCCLAAVATAGRPSRLRRDAPARGRASRR